LKQTNLEAQNKRNAAHIACALTRLIAGRTNSSIIAIKKKNGIIDIIILNIIVLYHIFLGDAKKSRAKKYCPFLWGHSPKKKVAL
jgi:hypothetical protein